MKKIIQTNAKIYITFILLFILAITLIPDKLEIMIPVAFGSTVFQALHTIICLILSFKNYFQGQKEKGLAYLISFLLLLLIGFPLCFGAAISGSMLHTLIK